MAQQWIGSGTCHWWSYCILTALTSGFLLKSSDDASLTGLTWLYQLIQAFKTFSMQIKLLYRHQDSGLTVLSSIVVFSGSIYLH